VGKAIFPEPAPQKAQRCKQSEIDDAHEYGRRDSGDEMRHSHPGSLNGSQARGHRKRGKNKRATEDAQDNGRRVPLAPQGDRRENEKRSADGQPEFSARRGIAQSS
jgi:hypothetical protein